MERLDVAVEIFKRILELNIAEHIAVGGSERRAARPSLILRHVGSDIERAATRQERRRVVALLHGAPLRLGEP